MKVIWAKEKLQDGMERKFTSQESRRTTSRPSVNTLTSMKGCTNFIIDNNNELSQESIYHEPQRSSDSQSIGGTVNLSRHCVVCGRDTGLRCLDDDSNGETCCELLEDCFGLKVSNPTCKVCEECAELIRSSHKFKELVTRALNKTISEEPSEMSLAESLNAETMTKFESSERRHIRRVTVKRRPIKKEEANRKTIMVCTICRQKYPMMNTHDANFVCSRCKLRRNERAVSCVRCNAMLPARALRHHLEMHATTELKGRCRLRSLTKKPSKPQTTETISRLNKPQRLVCKYCQKKFASGPTLKDHMKITHGDYSGDGHAVCKVCFKDFKRKEILDRHMKIHEKTMLYECNICGKIFKTSFAYQRHHRIHQTANAM